jgi:hypothetical protein
MAIKGAGGTEGGIGSFFLGLAMMIGGGYLFFASIQVVNHFHFGYSLFRLGSIPMTSGMVMIPFIFGIGIIFYNAKNPLGWLLAVGSLVMLSFGVVSSINFRMRSMSAFELIMILVLMIGGLGLFLRSLRSLGTS